MSIQSILFSKGAAKSDKKRDSVIPFPSGIVQKCNISYGPHGKWNLLDVYRPAGKDNCPIIVNIHGGGFVYGTKEVYKRYCMDLARRGFAVVNINYRLAPRWKFPTPMEDIHAAMQWVQQQAYWFGDRENVFMVGDSAGAQLTSQYAAMLTNPEYMALFGLNNSDQNIRLRAVGLNCGLYDMKTVANSHRKNLELDYLGRKISGDDPRLDVMGAITSAFPPAHITTACHDFLRPAAQPMYDHLLALGIGCQLDCYGSEADTATGHVFHVNILKDDAIRCNDDQCAFFRKHIKEDNPPG